jgi:hypothetical protein
MELLNNQIEDFDNWRRSISHWGSPIENPNTKYAKVKAGMDSSSKPGHNPFGTIL